MGTPMSDGLGKGWKQGLLLNIYIFFNVDRLKDAAVLFQNSATYLGYQNLLCLVCSNPLLLTHAGRHLVRTRENYL